MAALRMIVRLRMLAFMHLVAICFLLLGNLIEVSGFTTVPYQRKSRTILFAKSILLKSLLLKKQEAVVKDQPKPPENREAVVSSSAASVAQSTAENIIRGEFTEANKLYQLHRIDWIKGRCEIIVSAIPQLQQQVSEAEISPTVVDELQALQTKIYTKLETKVELTSLLAVTEFLLASPGVSDVLSIDRDFVSFKGFQVFVTLKAPFKDKLRFEGTLVERTPDFVRLSLKGRSLNIPRELVTEVRLPPSKYEPGDFEVFKLQYKPV